MEISEAFEQTFANTGAAVVFTALTLAIGVSTWSFSALNEKTTPHCKSNGS